MGKKSEVKKKTPPVPLTGEELQRTMRLPQLTEEGRKELRETARIDPFPGTYARRVLPNLDPRWVNGQDYTSWPFSFTIDNVAEHVMILI